MQIWNAEGVEQLCFKSCWATTSGRNLKQIWSTPNFKAKTDAERHSINSDPQNETPERCAPAGSAAGSAAAAARSAAAAAAGSAAGALPTFHPPPVVSAASY